MNNIIVTVGAVTYAMKLRKLLSRGGIQSKLVKVEDVEKHTGCVHGVEIRENDYLAAIKIMRENNIAYTIQSKRK